MPSDKFLDIAGKFFGASNEACVWNIGVFDIFRFGNSSRQLFTFGNRHHCVCSAVKDQRRNPHAGKYRRNIDAPVHEHQRLERPGLHDMRSNLPSFVSSSFMSSAVPTARFIICPVPQFAATLSANASNSASETECPDRGKAADQHKLRYPLRIGCRKQEAHRRSFGKADQHRSGRTNCIHHCANIVHPLFQWRNARNAIRKALAALVEADQPGEARKALHEGYATGPFVH